MNNPVSAFRIEKIQVVETLIVLGATMLIPFLVHLLPDIGGNLAGKVFLPIFIAPLVAVFFFRKHVALIAGLAAPLLNYLILGRPVPEMVLIMSVEVVLFVLVVSWLKDVRHVNYLAAPLAFIGASLVAALLMSVLGVIASPFAFWMGAIVVGIPGILVLAMFNFVLLKIGK
ncbi:MAG: hypothetical protein AB7U05_01590 [Mangrovibacterium sp.]